jgi:hypothetical protein
MDHIGDNCPAVCHYCGSRIVTGAVYSKYYQGVTFSFLRALHGNKSSYRRIIHDHFKARPTAPHIPAFTGMKKPDHDFLFG